MAKINIQLTKEQQQYLFLGLLVLGGGGYSYVAYFWKPISARIAETQKKIEETDAKISKAKGQAARLPKIKQELEVLNAQAVEAERQLPKKADLPAVIDTFSALAARHNVRVRSFAPGNQVASQYFIEIPYTVSVQTPFHDAARFFAALALQERIFNVRNVTYSTPDPEGRLNVSFTLVSYQYKS